MKHTSGYLKRTLSAVMAFIMAFGVLSSAGIIGLIASAADGTRGDRPLYEGAYWQFYDDGELVFTGETIYFISEDDFDHWKDPKSLEVFGDRVSSITIAPSVKKIQNGAFRFLKTSVVFIPDSVTEIQADAFEDSSIKTIYFPGHDTLWKEIYKGGNTLTNIVIKYDHRHNEGSLKHHAESTCVRNGYEGDYYCTECRAFVKEGKKLDKSSHSWSKETTYIVDSNGVPEKETCKDNGRKARYCTVCGTWDYVNAEIIPADTSKHEFTILDEKLVDCANLFSTQEGCNEKYVNLKCKHCGKTLKDLEGIDENGKGRDYQFYLDYVDKDNNKVGSYVLFGNDASGVNSGWKSIPADKQKLVVNKKAVEEYGMYREQMTYRNPTEAAQHRRIIDVDNSVAATCTGEGKTVVICEWCEKGYHQEYKVPALGHSNERGDKEVVIEIEAPRCPDYDKDEPNSAGNGLKITRCADCDEVLDEEPLDNLHAEGVRSATWVTVEEPTCVKDGVQKLRCNFCHRFIRDDNGKQLTKPVAKTPSVHTESRWFTTLEPTCTKNGERIKVCLNDGCPYHVNNPTSAAVKKASDRAALDVIQDVVRDTNRDNYIYNATETEATPTEATATEATPSEATATEATPADAATGTDADDLEVYDVAEEINIAMLAAFKEGVLKSSLELEAEAAATGTDATPSDASTESDAKVAELKDQIINIFETAVTHHGKWRVDIETLEEYFMLDEDYYKEVYPKAAEGCVGESENGTRYVFSQIVDKAADAIIASRSVINEIDDIVKALEDAWLALGDEDINTALENNKGDAAALTVKATAKEEIAALGHNFTRVSYVIIDGEYIPVAKDGDTWYEITGFEKDENGEFKKDNDGNYIPEVDTAGESYEDKYVVKEIDCTKADGIILSRCVNDGCSELDQKHVEKRIEHDMLTETKDATCLEGKYKREYCKYCDHENITVLGAPLGHIFKEKVIREATCSKAGIKVDVCDRCGLVNEKTYQTVKPIPHSDSQVNEPASCLEAGRVGVVCGVCGRFEGTIIDALGHDYVENIVEPTCTEQGYTTGTCSRCGAADPKGKYNIVKPAGHQYGESLNMPATCTKGSYAYELCKVCGYEKVYNEIDNALGHSMTTIAAKAATCTADGYTEKVYCTRPGCDYVEKESTVIKATGHKSENVPYKAASCTEDGNEAYVRCSVCKAELTPKVVIPKTGHHWKTTPGFEATCETAGQTESVACELCGEYQKPPVTIPAKGHDYGPEKRTKEAIFTGNDEYEKTCNVCGHTEKWEVPVKWYQRLIRIILYIFSLPFKLMARANGE